LWSLLDEREFLFLFLAPSTLAYHSLIVPQNYVVCLKLFSIFKPTLANTGGETLLENVLGWVSLLNKEGI
jgi:hypothetical protein